MDSHTSCDHEPLSEVGCERQAVEENGNEDEPRISEAAPNLLKNMEMLLSRLLAAPQPQFASSNVSPKQFIRFDPDDIEADIEGWCKITEILINDRNMQGTELLLALTYALRGRAATCLTRLKDSQISWPYIKEMLIAKFAKPMSAQDYFDEILRFQFSPKETSSEAAVRIWNLIERIPRTEMANGQVERVMRTLKCLLTIVENDPNKTWRDELPEVQLALNSTRSRVTGYTPTELMFGIRARSLGIASIAPDSEPELRLDLNRIRDVAAQNITQAANSEIRRFNRGRAAIKPFSKGDFVFIKCSERSQTKLNRKFKGPFIITSVLDNDRYELKNIDGSNRSYKYAHENLRAVPGGYEGLVDVATTLSNNLETTETVAVHGQETGDVSVDDVSDTESACSSRTMTAGSETLSASEREEL